LFTSKVANDFAGLRRKGKRELFAFFYVLSIITKKNKRKKHVEL